MLKLNYKRILDLRGIENQYGYLRRLGISQTLINNMLNDSTSRIEIKHLESFCKALHCTPNDIIEYVPNKTDSLSDDHPLKKLKPENHSVDGLKEKIDTMPISKLRKLKEIIDDDSF